MLVLSRKVGERILIEPGIEIAVVDVRGSRVCIGIDAPLEVRIHRKEVAPQSGSSAEIPMSAAGRSVALATAIRSASAPD